MTPLWLGIQTESGVTHAFSQREGWGPRWIGACGARLLLPENVRRMGGRIPVNKTVDCMSCLVHQARR